MFDVIEEAVCCQDTARELDLALGSVFKDCIRLGSLLTAFGLGAGGGLSSSFSTG